MKKTILKKAKQTLSLLLVLLMVVPMTVSFAIPVSAATAKYPVEGGYIHYDALVGEITGCDRNATKVIIPHSINNVTIKSIGEWAFDRCTSLTSVTIPNTIRSIENYAFNECTSLVSLSIPNSVTYIGEKAFNDCSSLESIILSESVTDIRNATFKGCSSLKSIIIPESVTYIGEWVFGYCSSLTSIDIPDGVPNISPCVFWGCTSLASITIPKSVTIIEHNAFANCKALEKIYYKGSEKEWAQISIDKYELPSTVEIIYNYPCSVDGHSFNEWNVTSEPNCYNDGSRYAVCSICSETIIETISTSGHVWGKWGKIKNPTCVTEGLDSRTCSVCGITETRLVSATGEHIYGEWIVTTEPECGTKGEEKRTCINCEVFETQSIPATENHTYGKWTTTIEPEYNAVGEECRSCLNCSTIETRPIPKTGIEYPVVGGNIYFNTSTGEIYDSDYNVTDVDIPQQINGVSVTSIGRYAFNNCNSLASITIPDSVTNIGESAFGSCSSLTSIIIPDGVKSIGKNAFEACGSLTTITIPKSVKNIDGSAFSFCWSLMSINVDDNNPNYTDVEGILFSKDKTELIRYCPKAKSSAYIIPDSVTSIGDFAFDHCKSLTSITIPNGITSIGNSAFSYCASLPSITLPDSVTSMGSSVFMGCESLTSITIPDCVKNIEDLAFYCCVELKSVIIPDSVTSIGVMAFLECNQLKVYYKGSKEEWDKIDIGALAFQFNPQIIFNYPCNVNGHAWDNWIVTSEPDCKNDGSKCKTCSVCDKSQIEAIPAFGHTWGDWHVTVTPDCENNGSKYKVCSICDETEIEVIEALEHTWGNWERIDEPSCIKDGLDSKTCEVCESIETRLVSKTGHNFSSDTKTCLTCGEKDWRGYTPISTPEELSAIRNRLYGKYYLVNDIVFTEEDFAEGGAFYNDGDGWIPIESPSSYTYFTGELDGNGHSIYNLQINIKSNLSTMGGLFSKNYGTIKNLGMEDFKISLTLTSDTTSYAGSFAGENCGTIENCLSIGDTAIYGSKGTGYAGGITGTNKANGTIKKCYNAGTVFSIYYSGGLSGQNSGLISDCYNSGYICAEKATGIYYAGGITGSNHNEIINCYNAGYISSQSIKGGITGIDIYDKISNCYYLDSCNFGNGFEDVGTTKCTEDHFKRQDTFGGFDFDSVWTMAGSNDYLYPELVNTPTKFSKKLLSVTLLSLPYKTQYYAKLENLDVTGGKLALVYNDGTYTEINITDDMVSGFDNTKVGKQIVTVALGEESVSFNVDILSLVYDDKLTTDEQITLEYTAKKNFTYVLSDESTAKITNISSSTIGWGSSITVKSSVTIVPLKPGYVVVRAVDDDGNILAKHLLLIEEGNHQMQFVEVVKEANCSESGMELYTCKFCEANETRLIPATGEHIFGEWSTVSSATCITDGQELRKCTGCDKSETRLIPATSIHNFGDWIVTTEPTCTLEGEETMYCANCDLTKTQAIPATRNHTYGDWIVTTEPTCVEGVETRHCANCDSTETQAIPATGKHTYGDWGVYNAPSCVHEGTGIRQCDICDTREYKPLPPTGVHNYGDWVVTTKPTVFMKGEQTRKCKYCDAAETQEIEKLEVMTNPFTDVKDGQWYTEGILWCYHSGYMAGVSETEFGRKSNVTRAMFATILAKIDGSDLSGYSKMSFTDVKPGQWYSNAIEWAASNGYAAGLGERIFGYKQNVSREQIALFFYTYSSKNGIDVSAEANLSGYADLNRVHSWALDAVEWAVAKGLISGTSETTLSPRDSATRAEIALIVKNYVETVKN